MSITYGLILGIVYAATPGPVTVETLRWGLKSGIFASLALQAGTTVGRVVYSLLALFGTGVILRNTSLQTAVGVFGVTVLFYLGISAIRNWRSLAVRSGPGTAVASTGRQAFWSGAALSLASPLAVVFWLSIGARIAQDPGLDGLPFLFGFFSGCIVTSLVVALFASFWQSRLTARALLTISWTCGLLLIGFGLKLGLSMGQSILVW